MFWTFLADVERRTWACVVVVGDGVEEGSSVDACEVEGHRNDRMVGEDNLGLVVQRNNLGNEVSGEEMTLLSMEAVPQQLLSCFQCVAAYQEAYGGSTSEDHDEGSDATCSQAVEDEDCLVSTVFCYRLK